MTRSNAGGLRPPGGTNESRAPVPQGYGAEEKQIRLWVKLMFHVSRDYLVVLNKMTCTIATHEARNLNAREKLNDPYRIPKHRP